MVIDKYGVCGREQKAAYRFLRLSVEFAPRNKTAKTFSKRFGYVVQWLMLRRKIVLINVGDYIENFVE